MKKENFPLNQIIAHRGIYDNKTIPENSILAFILAKEKRYIIEFDIRLSKDNAIIIFHDATLKRMTSINKKIKNLTYDEIKNITLLNTKEKIPTLQKTLSIINGKVPILIELKENNILLCKKLVENIKNYSGVICIQSFYPNIIRWFQKNYPNYLRGLLLGINYKKNLRKFIFNRKDSIFLCKPNFLAVAKDISQSHSIKKLRINYPILIWTINNIIEFKYYKNKGEGLICNNLPYY